MRYNISNRTYKDNCSNSLTQNLLNNLRKKKKRSHATLIQYFVSEYYGGGGKWAQIKGLQTLGRPIWTSNNEPNGLLDGAIGQAE